MEQKVAAGGARAASPWEIPRGPCAVAVLALSAACPAAWAQQPQALPSEGVVVAEARVEPPLRLEVQSGAVPRLESHDTGFQAPRVDVSLFPARAHGLGAMVGVTGAPATQPQALGLAPNRTQVDLGLRWTHTLPNAYKIDVTAWRRMTGPDDAYSLIQHREQPLYGARVEMNVKPAKIKLFGLERGFLGFQLEGGGRIAIKRKDGRPMVYYRTTF